MDREPIEHCPLCSSADVELFDAYAYKWWTCMKCGWMAAEMKPRPEEFRKWTEN